MRFRANDQFCAQVWDSGRVVIYDNVTGMVLGEYVPESHLQCAANCVRWEVGEREASGPFEKKYSDVNNRLN